MDPSDRIRIEIHSSPWHAFDEATNNDIAIHAIAVRRRYLQFQSSYDSAVLHAR